MSVTLPLDLPICHNVYDIALLSDQYNVSKDHDEKFEIVSKAITCDISQIARLGPGQDLDNPVLYSKIKEFALVDKNTKTELIDIFTYSDEDASQALAHYNIEVFLHIVRNHVSYKPDPNFVDKLVLGYKRNKNQASANKILCLAPYTQFQDKKINKLIAKGFNLS